MKGDFSRNTFDPKKHYTRVLMQQGRVQLDADLNESRAIAWHYHRRLTTDLIGPHAGPASDLGFGIRWQVGAGGEPRLMATPGRYYVEGLPCENDAWAPVIQTPVCMPGDSADFDEDDGAYLVYLDTWERHVTYVEDDAIREVALGGPDTSSRVKVAWQLRLTPLERGEGDAPEERLAELVNQHGALTERLEDLVRSLPGAGTGAVPEELRKQLVEVRHQIGDVAAMALWIRARALCDEVGEGNAAITGDGLWPIERIAGALMDALSPALSIGYLRARAYRETTPEDPCITPPEARYRGPENQLYRVEVYKGGPSNEATFTWSRNNGAEVYPVLELATGSDTTTCTLEHLGRDDRSALTVGDWVEVEDDRLARRGRRGSLHKVRDVYPETREVVLDGALSGGAVPDVEDHPRLRRWQSEGEVPLREHEDRWMPLEDGIEIQVRGGVWFKPGDYWLIPARTATGDVEWPQWGDVPAAMPPHGVRHGYAPLAVVTFGDRGFMLDTRRVFHPFSIPAARTCRPGPSS